MNINIKIKKIPALLLMTAIVVMSVPLFVSANVISTDPTDNKVTPSESPQISDEQRVKIMGMALPWEKNFSKPKEREREYLYSTKTLNGGQSFITREGLDYVFPISEEIGNIKKTDPENSDTQATLKENEVIYQALRERFLGGSMNNITDGETSPTTITKFLGYDESNYGKSSKALKNVMINDVWKGISVNLKAYNNNIEKIFQVQPNIDYKQIQVGIDGARALKVSKNKQLTIITGSGEVSLTAPVAFQYINGKKKFVDVEYQLNCTNKETNETTTCDEYIKSQNNEIKNTETPAPSAPDTESYKNTEFSYYFNVGTYDQSKLLFIDPLLASTYVGGAAGQTSEFPSLQIVLANSSIYVAGATSNTEFFSPNGYDKTFNGGYDIVVARFSTNFSTLINSTFLGSVGNDSAYGIASDTIGNIYIAGNVANKIEGRFGQNGFQSTYSGGTVGVVAKFSSTLDTLLSSTYFGNTNGINSITVNNIVLDNLNNVIIGGITKTSFGSNYSMSGYQATPGGNNDFFAIKFNSSLSSLLGFTYLGSVTNDYDATVVVDSSNNIYMMGYIGGAVTQAGFGVGGYQPTYGGGSSDGVIAKFDSSLINLLASTYIGGTFSEHVRLTSKNAVTSTGIYIGGRSNGAIGGGFGTGGYQSTYQGDATYGAWAAKLSLNLSTLIASTYIGENSKRFDVHALDIDSAGNPIIIGVVTYVVGSMPSFGVGSFQTTNGGGTDNIIVKLNSSLTNIVSSTFAGGTNTDWFPSVTLDSSDNIYIVGYAGGTIANIGIGGFQSTHGGGSYDMFFLKLNPAMATNLGSTYFGGNNGNGATGVDSFTQVAIDSTGEVLVYGVTQSLALAKTGGYDMTFAGSGQDDLWVGKFNNELTMLKASTYIGGIGNEKASGVMSIDDAHNIFITGGTTSTDFPVTVGAYKTIYNGGAFDAFIVKLNSSLSALLMSTYIGGSGYDAAVHKILFNTDGTYTVSLSTNSIDMPTTIGAYDATFNGGTSDMYIAKFNSNFTLLMAGTYFGGSCIELPTLLNDDGNGNIFFGGDSCSTDIPLIAGGYDILPTGLSRGFIGKMNSNLTTLLATSLIGFGSNGVGLFGTYLDNSKNIIILGGFNSNSIPTTVGVFQPIFGGGYDYALLKFNNNLTNLLQATYIGGTGNDYPARQARINVDLNQNYYLALYSGSSNFPGINAQSYRQVYSGGSSDGVLIKINPTFTAIQTTFFGGNDADTFLDSALDSNGNIYAVGQTKSSNFPSTNTSYQPSYSGVQDGFIIKLDTATLGGNYVQQVAGSKGYAIQIDRDGTGPDDYDATIYYTSGKSATENLNLPLDIQGSNMLMKIHTYNVAKSGNKILSRKFQVFPFTRTGVTLMTNSSGGTSGLLSQVARAEKQNLIRGINPASNVSGETSSSLNTLTTETYSTPKDNSGETSPNSVDQYGNPLYTIYKKDSKGGVLLSFYGKPTINKTATEKAKQKDRDFGYSETAPNSGMMAVGNTGGLNLDMNLTDKETLAYPTLMKNIQVFVIGSIIEKVLKPIEITNNKPFITKYQDTVRKQKVLSGVKLPTETQISDYIKVNEPLRDYFCENLQTPRTLSRGVYKNAYVKVLQQFYGYILHIPIEIDLSYGTFMGTLASIFHTQYQGETKLRTTFTPDDISFVKDLIECQQ